MTAVDHEQLRAKAEVVVDDWDWMVEAQPDGFYARMRTPAHAEFIAAANPATILGLLDEVDHQRASHDVMVAMLTDAETERDRLAAECDAWRHDADQLAAVTAMPGQMRPHATEERAQAALAAHRALVGRDRTAPTTEETP